MSDSALLRVQLAARLWTALLDAVFPPRCAGCRGWSKASFCPACQPLLRRIELPFCSVCGKPSDPQALALPECAECRDNRYHGAPPYRMLRSACYFEGPLRDAVHRFKYQEKTALAEALGDLMFQFLIGQPSGKPAIPTADLAVVVPVPLHGWRQYRRGYNQSELLARTLARRLEIPGAGLLQRIRHTRPQVEMSAKERKSNLHGAFAIASPVLETANAQRRPVLLVDDVCTTGSTIRECARVLKTAGIEDVYALTLARQV